MRCYRGLAQRRLCPHHWQFPTWNWGKWGKRLNQQTPKMKTVDWTGFAKRGIAN